jgi:hypothetical protein
MKNSLRFLALAAFVAIPFVGRAQVTYTNLDSSAGSVSLTTAGYAAGVGSATFLSANTAIQTFSGFSSLSSISWSLTDSFTGSPTNFSAYVAQWDVPNSRVTGVLTSFGAGAFNPGNGATANLAFTGSWTAPDPSQTYALLLTATSGSGNFVANVGTSPGGANAAFFGSGAAGYATTSSLTSPVTFVSDLANSANVSMFTPSSAYAYTMSVNGTLATLAPVPEPKTAAAGIAALFVAALIGHRTWQRRKLAAIPVVA